MGNLTSEQQRALLQAATTQGQLGQTAGQLTGQDATRQLQAAQELRTSGGALAQLAEADAVNQRAIASGYGTLAGQMQGADLEALKAQMGAGAVGQGQIQKNFDAGVAAFNEEKNYPNTTLDDLIKRMGSLAPPGVTTTGSVTNYVPPSTSDKIGGYLAPILNLGGRDANNNPIKPAT